MATPAASAARPGSAKLATDISWTVAGLNFHPRPADTFTGVHAMQTLKFNPLLVVFVATLVATLVATSSAWARETQGGAPTRAVPNDGPSMISEDPHEAALDKAIASGNMAEAMDLAKSPFDLNRITKAFYQPATEAHLLPKGSDISQMPVHIDAYVNVDKDENQHLDMTWTDENGTHQKTFLMSAGKNNYSKILVNNCFAFHKMVPRNDPDAKGIILWHPSFFRGKRPKNGSELDEDPSHEFTYAIHGLDPKQKNFGPNYANGKPQSNGCLRVLQKDAEFIEGVLEKAGVGNSGLCVH